MFDKFMYSIQFQLMKNFGFFLVNFNSFLYLYHQLAEGNYLEQICKSFSVTGRPHLCATQWRTGGTCALCSIVYSVHVWITTLHAGENMTNIYVFSGTIRYGDQTCLAARWNAVCQRKWGKSLFVYSRYKPGLPCHSERGPPEEIWKIIIWVQERPKRSRIVLSPGRMRSARGNIKTNYLCTGMARICPVTRWSAVRQRKSSTGLLLDHARHTGPHNLAPHCLGNIFMSRHAS